MTKQNRKHLVNALLGRCSVEGTDTAKEVSARARFAVRCRMAREKLQESLKATPLKDARA